MPNVLLSVPHFEQSRDGTCLPACLQMVLSFWGDEETEARLIQQLGTKRYGTPISNAKRLRDKGYDVHVGPLTRSDLESYLTNGRPIIARVWTLMLDYWQTVTSHVVVVVGYDDDFVFVNDPAMATAPIPVLWDAFLAAWAEYDETAVVLAKT